MSKTSKRRNIGIDLNLENKKNLLGNEREKQRGKQQMRKWEKKMQ